MADVGDTIYNSVMLVCANARLLRSRILIIIPRGLHFARMSLIAEMMNMVRESAAHNNITRISRIKLVVGKLTMAMPHSLRFAFHTMARDGLFQGAELLIEEREVAYQCCQCGEKYLPDMPYGQLLIAAAKPVLAERARIIR